MKDLNQMIPPKKQNFIYNILWHLSQYSGSFVPPLIVHNI